MDSELGDETLIESNFEEIEEHIIHNGEETVKKYLKGRFLGKGGFAKCYELKCVNNKKVFAGKIISKSNIIKPSAKAKLKSEIKIHKSLSHHNIVKFEHYFEDSDNVYILLELCKSKTLNELLKKRKMLSELEVKYYLYQILLAVKYMHKSKVIHRDLKLGNLLLSSNLEIKISDFGLATKVEYDGERKHTVCGTPNYIAPEILENKNGHSYEVDYWAIGVIVYTLLIGKPPFETDEVKETYKKINANNYIFPKSVFISDIAKDFIRKILVSNPSKRLTPDLMLTHAFMKDTPIPKEMPHYTLSNPPKIDFFRMHRSNEEQKTTLMQLSFETEKENNLESLRKFALNTVKKCDDMNKAFIDIRTSQQRFKNIAVNTSDCKEQHEMLKKKLEEIDLDKLIYCDVLYDYSDKFGVLFKMINNDIIGCVFNDRSVLFKYINHNNICYEHRKKKIHKVFDVKNVISTIKPKYEVVSNFEKYVLKERGVTKSTSSVVGKGSNESYNFINCVYVQKIIKSDIAILCKFSNKVIQVSFKDNTKIIIDSDISQQIYFFDKGNKRFHYSVHLVNKCNNKRFMNRYEHYKTIYFQKMDEKFQKKQRQRELDTSTSREHIDLNKTT